MAKSGIARAIFLTVLLSALLPQNVAADEFAAQIFVAGQTDEIADSGLLWLINGENRLGEKYVPGNLKKYQGLLMRAEIIEPFKQMLEAMKADEAAGLYIQSAYRDYGHQSHLFSQKKSYYISKGYPEAEAEAQTSKSLAYPGASEHQSGLALDVTVDGQLRQSFGETKQGIWLAENCYKFGFIIRYPQDKTDITRIIYEPWHLRYVGAPHAALMKEKNICLEEYMDYLGENEKCIYWIEQRKTYYLVTSHASAEDARAYRASGMFAPDGAVTSADRPGEAARHITVEIKTLIE